MLLCRGPEGFHHLLGVYDEHGERLVEAGLELRGDAGTSDNEVSASCMRAMGCIRLMELGAGEPQLTCAASCALHDSLSALDGPPPRSASSLRM